MVNYVTPFMRRTVCAMLLSLLLSVPVTAAGVHRFFNIGREAGLGDLEVVGIRRDSVGYMWFYTPQATFRYDGYSFLRHDGPGHGAADAVGSLVIPELGQRWAATDNDGIAIYGAGGEMAGRLRREDGNPFSLPTNHITCLYRDGDGTVWVGTSKGGVAYCSVYGLDFSVTALPRHEDASCFWEPGDGSLWIGLDGKGIVQLSADGRVATTIDNTNSALTSNSVIGACRNADGSFYLATYGGGIVRFDGGRLSRPRWGMLPSIRYPHKMAYDTHGNLWIGSVKAGLTRIDASGRATVYTYSNSGLNTNAVTDVASDRSGRVFVATGTGLAYISDSGGRQRVVAASADTSATSLGRMPITAIAVDGRRILWVGTAGGLRVYALGGGARPAFRLLSALGPSAGVGVVRAIAEDKSGNMWVTTDRGVLQVTVRAEGGGYRFGCHPYSFGAGGVRPSFAKYSLYCARGGDIIAGTFGRIVRIDPRSARPWNAARMVTVTGVAVNGQSVRRGGGAIPVLDSGDDLSISVSSFDYMHSADISYLYRLDGDSAWCMAEGNVISLAGMEPGAHVLEITTGTGDGAPPVTRVDIAVRRPVMWSAVFWLLVSFAAVACGYALHVRRKPRRAHAVEAAQPSFGGARGADAEFVARATRIVEEHLGDFEFSVEDFSRLMLVSRSSLYKKLTALTGQSPLEFIRKIRLRRGRELLAGRGLTIAEVAYSVGLSPKQFSKFFKEEYGVLPSRINGDGTEK